MPQRRVGGDAGAEKRRNSGERVRGLKLLWDAEDEVLIDDDGARVAAVGHAAQMRVRRVVSAGESGLTVLLQADAAAGTGAVRVNHAADGGEVSGMEALDLTAHGGDAADDFVSGDHRVGGVGPLVARGVQIRVADAAVEDVELDVLGQRLSAGEGKRRERRAGGGGCVSQSLGLGRSGGWESSG
jgi:hypothetical protein